MAHLADAFDYFGVCRKNPRWSWSGRSLDGETVVLTLWKDQITGLKKRPVVFDNYGKKVKTIADVYGGSGSTLIACEKTKRKCYMMEIDPHYIDVIVNRWCKFTGETKIKRNGKSFEWSIQE